MTEARSPEGPETRRSGLYGSLAKRLLDLALTIPAGLLLLPVLGLTALAVRLSLGPPALFRQRRLGLHGRPFTLFKFRTMSPQVGTDGRSLPDSERMTRLGTMLRRASLDELPELWNVLRGDMSLVGPRPLLPQYADRYSPAQARRQEVKPGITGWSQVNGRNALTWEKKFQLDVWYVDHLTPWLDCKILVITLWIVLTGRGIAAADHVTMPEFRGHGDE